MAGDVRNGGSPTPVSMFGLRWINPVTLHWHTRPDCPALKASRTRSGWLPFPITAGYGRRFYTQCSRCR